MELLMSVLIPTVLLLVVICVANVGHAGDGWWFLIAVLGLVWFCWSLVAPASYSDSLDTCIRLENYYEVVAKPAAVAETDTALIVSVESITAGIWQAGSMNLSTYNTELASLRYWNNFPVIGGITADPNPNLKFVQVAQGR